MASLVLSGDTSGSITVSAPAVAGSNTQTLVATTGTLAPIVSGTAVSASGTSVDFTGIPSWVKRITVMFSGVSTNGTSNLLIQIGSGSVTTSGYVSYATYQGGTNQASGTTSTSGFLMEAVTDPATVRYGHAVFTLLSGNSWVGSLNTGWYNGTYYYSSAGGGGVTLSSTLDRIRITTVGGVNTFDAGTINILYE